DTGTLEFFRVVVCVGHNPVPAEELHRIVPFVGDSHRVAEGPLALERLRMPRHVLGLDFDADIVRDRFGCRRVRLLIFGCAHESVRKPHAYDTNYEALWNASVKSQRRSASAWRGATSSCAAIRRRPSA